MSIVDSLKKLAVKLGRAQTPEEIYAPDITTALKQVADDPSKVPGSSIDDVIDVLADKIEPGGGSGIPFPEVTVTLNIDHPENVLEISADVIYERIGNRFKKYKKDYTQGETAPAQSIITGAILPISNYGPDSDYMNYYGISWDLVNVAGDGDYYYVLAFSEVVNLKDLIDGAENTFEVIDPTKPVSCTITATRMTGQ